MKSNQKKSITLDELAVTVEKGFKAVDVTINNFAISVAKGFDVVNKRLDAMDVRFDGVDARFDGIDERLDAVEVRLGHVEKGFLNLKGEIEKMGNRFVARYEFDTLLSRVMRLEEKVDKKYKS